MKPVYEFFSIFYDLVHIPDKTCRQSCTEVTGNTFSYITVVSKLTPYYFLAVYRKVDSEEALFMNTYFDDDTI